jgi:mono/diheme cytochrome c family protein/glucose/arabinose dehydrogenase
MLDLIATKITTSVSDCFPTILVLDMKRLFYKRLFLLFVAFVLLRADLIFAQDDDELVSGLNLSFKAGTKSVARSAAGVSFDWSSQSPDQRLSDGRFDATWTGSLLVQQSGKHRFFAFVDGSVEIRLAGHLVLSGESDKPRWIAGDEFSPDRGLQPFKMTFKKKSKQARVHIFWASESFPIEPLPSQFQFSDSTVKAANATFDSGRSIFSQSRCVNCHQRENATPALDAPDLSRSTAHLKQAWIVDKLQGRISGTMPQFGFTAKDSQDVAAFLQSQAKSVSLEQLPKAGKGRDDSKDATEGHTLLSSLGCVACHGIQENKIKSIGKSGAPDLSSIGIKRSREWIYTWLKKPANLNATHRMPIFTLSNTERRQLAIALSFLQGKPDDAKRLKQSDAKATKAQIERGRKLVTTAGCVSCHDIGGMKKLDRSQLADLSKPINDWEKSCLNKQASLNQGRPAFPQVNATAVREFVDKSVGKLSELSAFDRGVDLMQAKGCNDCHPRNQLRGLSASVANLSKSNPALRGLAPAMVPPSLTAVGDKLLDSSLLKAIHGEQAVRKPWLKVRMPKFKHSKDEANAIVAYLIGQDRIPDGAPGVVQIRTEKVDDQSLVVGQALVGPKGFSCIACHKVGDYEPRNTALGTKGSDLLAMGKRMRPSFFMRWTRSPLRIVPGLEMPSYIKPAKGAFGDDIDRQLQALWHTLNDPRFEAPTNPASVEQYLVVDNGSARIVRDVFENPKENGGGHVARAFAIGFGNQHNALFDLDTMTLRAWTFGDFARQRTSGKSWYWDMAGSYVMTGFGSESDYSLKPKNGSKSIAPLSENGTVGRLLSYKNVKDGVELRFRLTFEVAGRKHGVEVTELLAPLSAANLGAKNHKTSQTQAKQTGWQRIIQCSDVPKGFEFSVAQPKVPTSSTLGNPQIQIAEDSSQSTTISIMYSAELQAPALNVSLKPAKNIAIQRITSVPGFEGWQLPLPGSIMPTALTTLPDGTLAFTSLKGDVYLVRDTDNDGVEDKLTLFEEGLSAPYGILADGDSILVSHKPEVIRLRDTNGDGRADQREVFATGWGFNDNYHDWACSLIKNSKGEMFLGLGGDYSQKGRPKEKSRWRGTVVAISPKGKVRPFSHGFRYTTGLAIDSKDRLFGTDNQGVQNCFNEINHLRDGVHYGVPALHEQDLKFNPAQPAIQVPHPWTRSVNGIAFLPQDFADRSLRGHGIGCEYNGKLLVRWTYHEVDDQLQGATFFMSKPNYANGDENFLGPINTHVTKAGEIYVGSIHDSGWLGGLNTGSIVKLKLSKRTQNGIRDIRATKDGFRLDFFLPVDNKSASDASQYSLSGYTRVWGGGYATPDSGRYEPKVTKATVSENGTSVDLTIDRRQQGYVYEINCKLKSGTQSLWPATGHYTLHRIPR